MSAYTAQDITVLDQMDHIRRRPSMYIGSTDADGLHHLMREIVDNAVDEVMNGHASRIEVTLLADGRTVEVSDNGRGIPVDEHKEYKKSALEIIFTIPNSGAKFDRRNYATSGGLHGVGASVVNVLSESLDAVVRRDGYEWSQSYKRGRPRGGVTRGKATKAHGTTVRFTPDTEIFGDTGFEAETIRAHLVTCTFLNKGLLIVFNDALAKTSEDIRHAGGVADFVSHLIKEAGATPTIDRQFTLERGDDPRVDLSLCWTDAPRERLRTFVNGIPTKQGGTHEQGIKDGIVKALRNYIETHDATLPRGLKPTAEDIREGIVAVGSVFIGEPQFQGQTKDRLNNPEVKGQVEGVVRPALERWLQDNSSTADAILARVVMAARAREASREATAQVRRKSPVQRKLNLPGKLADCSSSDPARSELFIVEGDSAGGSAKQGRDRMTQAILPLRGKVLNSEQANLNKVLGNSELTDIVNALGCGIGKDLDPSRLRYNRIILLMDADSDGHHIATLLLTFFFRYLRPLVERGHVFLAQPPLFRIDAGKKTWWAADERERDRIIRKLPPRAKPDISRFKGLGEMMPKTLYETTLDPAKRRLLRVEIPEGAALETEQVVADLLGKDPQTRFREITRWMSIVEEVDA
jgi:DNA gyrase subunit B/topoisomerase-4 subunit B